MINENKNELCADINPEEIVISGISGIFPGANNMKQLQEYLFNKVDLVTDKHNRWKLEHSDLPKRMGIINNLNKFDADYFNMCDIQANTLDPVLRRLLEHTYEAIVDAGINPMQLRGRNIATIVGQSFFDTQEILMYRDLQINGVNLTGSCRASMANLISYWLDLKGPSYVVDSACSSTLYAIAIARYYITSGKCEDAIVASGNLCLHPKLTMQFFCLGALSPTGYCKPFDVNANGYTRSDTISVIYLQKAKNAKRIYALCKHIKLNSDGFKEEGITFPSKHMQTHLLTEFYQECGISPTNVEYVEAHGTGTKVGDPSEVNAICNVFCKDRKTPLLIGSVKSNLGHAESASGINQIAKAIIAMETGFIPPMINFTSPREDIESLRNGTVRVATEPTRLTNGYIGINSFGFGGSNGHLLLKWNPKKKINNGAPNDDLPRLVTVSGRTEESVQSFLKDVANHPLDVEYIRLLHDIHACNIEGHSWRGYIILEKTQQRLIKEIQVYKNNKTPVWFIFSGVGSQWFGIGQHLLKFPVFARSIKMCDNVLKQYNVNVTAIITMIDERMNKSPVNTLLCIVAIQIGLVDLLTSLGIIPDNMIGYSVGELGCAYADKCLTIEQTILSAYLIALACVESTVPCGSMATVNLDYETLKTICPADIKIACRNSPKSNVISGPAECVRVFMKTLQARGTNVQKISCNNIPYHSHYLASIKDELLRSLSLLISQPKKRSSRWISTSVSSTEWSISQMCSADYLTNSILTTVLFEQTIRMIPNNAVTIEIAPTSVLQHILKESLHPQVTNIMLTQCTNENPVALMFQGIGKLYNCGLQPQIAALYPPVEFPVSRGTPMISPSIKWDHSKNWIVAHEIPKYDNIRERLVKVQLSDEDYEYMTGHVIDGRTLLPAMGYVVLVWETIGKIKGELYLSLPIIFRDLRFVRATHLSKNDSVKLTIRIHEGSGKFEVCEEDTVVVTGEVSTEIDPKQKIASFDLSPDKEEEHMNTLDIYKELKLRGYQYSGVFRGLISASITGDKGHVVWTSNWVTFMDTLLQLNIFGKNSKGLYVPTNIQKLVINPILHNVTLRNYAKINTTQNSKQLPVRVYKNMDLIISGGVEIWGVKTTLIARRKINADPVIEEYRFTAHQDREKISLHDAIRISTQIALEDHQITKMKIIEVVEDTDIVSTEDLTTLAILEVCNNLLLVQASITLITSPFRFKSSYLPSNVTFADLRTHVDNKVLMIIGFNLLSKRSLLERILLFLEEGGFLLSRETYDVTEPTESHRDYSALIGNDNLEQYGLNVILEKRTKKEMIVLLKKQVTIKETTVVHITNNNFEWLEKWKLLVDKKKTFDRNNRIVIVSEGDFECGLLGFVNCLRKEPGGEFVRSVFVQDETAPKFSLQDPFYAQQLRKDMTVNVLGSKKTWGSYRHFCLPAPEPALVPAAYVCQTVLGDLSSFCWMENDIFINSHCEDLIRVTYSSLNFKDVMLATGKLTSESSEERFESVNLGLEYVGFDAEGRRVMGMRDNKCIANIVLKSDFQWIIPDTWTFEEAATIPCVYSTSYYALYIKGKIKKGDKILIHCGSGGVGQSAINLALHEKCEVFTTVGTAEKRRFIRETFPTIPDDHIGNSHNISFEQMVMRQTNGRGVDIVLNSLAEEKLLASVRCLAQNGRFLEIGRYDLVSNNPLDVSLFRKGISFYGIFLDSMFGKEHKHKAQLVKLMNDGLKNGVIKPIEAKVFQRTEIEQAFRYMASGKHKGKIILNIQEADKCRMNAPIVAHRRYYCYSDRIYIILGGLGGFGLELTEWLISRGARNFVLTSRSGIKHSYQRMKVSLWRSYGVNVTIIKDNITTNPIDCEHFLRCTEKKTPVDAIFNLAAILKDNILENQTTESFVESFKAKVWPTQTLDKLSRKICSKLRHFVVFSSVSCGRGISGQTNYGMANSVMERICERRVKDGFPGLAIQWGSTADVGLVANMQNNSDKELVISGMLQQKISSCLNELDKFLLQNRPIVGSVVIAEKKQEVPEFFNVFRAVAAIMNIENINKIRPTTSLAELGMDSILAVEIRQTLERHFDVYLSLQEIRNLTFAKLLEMSDTRTVADGTSR